MVYILSTTIRVSRETKKELDKVLAILEKELEKRLDYDEVIRILIRRSRILKKPELLAQFLVVETDEEESKIIQDMLRRERRRDLEIERKRYST